MRIKSAQQLVSFPGVQSGDVVQQQPMSFRVSFACHRANTQLACASPRK